MKLFCNQVAMDHLIQMEMYTRLLWKDLDAYKTRGVFELW